MSLHRRCANVRWAGRALGMSCRLQVGCAAPCTVHRASSAAPLFIGHTHTLSRLILTARCYSCVRLPTAGCPSSAAALSGVTRLDSVNAPGAAPIQTALDTIQTTGAEQRCKMWKQGLPGGWGTCSPGWWATVRLQRPHPSDAARFFKGDSQHRGYSHLQPPCQVRQAKTATSAATFQSKSSAAIPVKGLYPLFEIFAVVFFISDTWATAMCPVWRQKELISRTCFVFCFCFLNERWSKGSERWTFLMSVEFTDMQETHTVRA